MTRTRLANAIGTGIAVPLIAAIEAVGWATERRRTLFARLTHQPLPEERP